MKCPACDVGWLTLEPWPRSFTAQELRGWYCTNCLWWGGPANYTRKSGPYLTQPQFRTGWAAVSLPDYYGRQYPL